LATTLTTKPLGFLNPDPNQPRKAFDEAELRALGESLKRKQIVPVLARPDGMLLDGHRRWLAAKLVGLDALMVIITDEPLTPAQIMEIQLVNAMHRADLKPYEQFEGARSWLALNRGATVAELAAKISRDPSMLTRIMSLAKCIPPVQQAASEGQLGPSQWYAISKVADAAEQQAMLDATLAGVSRDQLESRGRKLRCAQATVKVNRLKIPLGLHGRSVTIAGSNLSLDDAIDILQETLKLARKAQGENLDGKTWVQVMKQKAKAG
jgi:ParB family transcriptional regulator, chromosome partitioning protein